MWDKYINCHFELCINTFTVSSFSLTYTLILALAQDVFEMLFAKIRKDPVKSAVLAQSTTCITESASDNGGESSSAESTSQSSGKEQKKCLAQLQDQVTK